MKKVKHVTSKITAILIAMTLMVSTLVSTTASAATATATATTISGKLTMDTLSYTLAPGKIYDFRAKIEGTGVNQADVTVTSSRDAIASVHRNTGSDTYRVTGLKEGVTYITSEAYGVHTSIKITVTVGVKQHGEGCRATSIISTRYATGKYEIGVGKDIPAGEYVLLAKAGTSGYFVVHKDVDGKQDDFIVNGIVSGRTRITLANERYLELYKNTIMCPYSDAPKLDKSSGALSEGTYKVGSDADSDLAPGTYKVCPTDHIIPGYYCIFENGAHNIYFDGASNKLFTTDVYVTLTEGQYIELLSAKIMFNS